MFKEGGISMSKDRYVEEIEAEIDLASDLFHEMEIGALERLEIELNENCKVVVVRDGSDFAVELVGETDEIKSPTVEIKGKDSPVARVIPGDCDLAESVLDFIYDCMD